MFRELQERFKLIRHNNAARVFAAGINGRYWYPYRLMSAKEAGRSTAEECFELIVDSAYTHDDVGNKKTIEAAIDANADYIIMADAPGSQKKTHNALKEFINLYKEHVECSAKPFVVLQPPYADHYEQYEDVYSRFSHFALGGLHQFDPWQQISAIREFRMTAGAQVYVHALGIGTDFEIVSSLRDEPRLVDSLDVSTAEQAIKNNKIPDKKWEQTRFYVPEGVDSTTVRARFSESILSMLNYVLGPNVDDDELKATYESQTVLGEVAKMQKDEHLSAYKGGMRERYEQKREVMQR
jgi:hypothetical protein